MIRNTVFESERIALQRIKPEFRVFPIAHDVVMLTNLTLAIQLLGLLRARGKSQSRGVNQPKSGNFRPCRPKSVDVATPATLLTLITGTESAPLKIAGAEIQ
jgi:hypothetical protein